MAEGTGIVAVEDIRIQILGLATAHRRQEVPKVSVLTLVGSTGLDLWKRSLVERGQIADTPQKRHRRLVEGVHAAA